MRAEFAKLGYSPALTGQELSIAQDTQPPAVTIWLDAKA
jgi:hypothetical protein